MDVSKARGRAKPLATAKPTLNYIQINIMVKFTPSKCIKIFFERIEDLDNKNSHVSYLFNLRFQTLPCCQNFKVSNIVCALHLTLKYVIMLPWSGYLDNRYRDQWQYFESSCYQKTGHFCISIYRIIYWQQNQADYGQVLMNAAEKKLFGLNTNKI